MKVYAMMYRAKRKDAVDVYMLLEQGLKLEEMINCAKTWFTDLYQVKATLETIEANERDLTEEVMRLLDSPPTQHQIQQKIMAASDEYLRTL